VTDTAAPLATVALVSDRPRWSVLDTVLVAGITALASVLRLAHITRPSGFVFDEFYASDACLYLRGPSGGCMTATEISVAHPPLAKWLIAVGIRLFGFNPAGWRFAPFVAGTLSVAVLYLLARRLLGSTPGAALAAVLLTFDFLHFVMSRTAMLDVFVVLFGLTAFVCLLYDRDRTAVPRTGFPAQVWARPWLLGAGLAAGAAVACKWSVRAPATGAARDSWVCCCWRSWRFPSRCTWGPTPADLMARCSPGPGPTGRGCGRSCHVRRRCSRTIRERYTPIPMRQLRGSGRW
jgi:dolichyl-phosphate-mannose--protein O-mannosyl transferase